jgi:hypothetical protein
MALDAVIWRAMVYFRLQAPGPRLAASRRSISDKIKSIRHQFVPINRQKGLPSQNETIRRFAVRSFGLIRGNMGIAMQNVVYACMTWGSMP